MFKNSIPFEEKDELPHDIAVYGVYRNDDLLYVGSAVGINRRFRSHPLMKDFILEKATHIKWNVYTHEEGECLKEDERVFIECYSPKLNKGSFIRSSSRCKKHIKNQSFPRSVLAKKTFELLWEFIDRDLGKTHAIDVISSETNLTFAWLDNFARYGTKNSASVDRIEHLYRFLTGKDLEVKGVLKDS